jgi:iron complex transport system permease protein
MIVRVSARRGALFYAAALSLLVSAAILGVAVGSFSIAPSVVLRVVASRLLPGNWAEGIGEPEQAVIWLIRAPRVLVGGLVGAALAIAGTQMQGLARNPLASPDLLGASSASALGAVLAMATGLAARSSFYIPVCSFVGALLALFLICGMAVHRGRAPISMLILAGIALNAMIGAAISFLITVSWVRYEVSREMLFWMMGGLDGRTWSHVWIAMPFVIFGAVVAWLYARDLDLISLGEESALSLGVDVESVKRMIVVSSALLTSASVAVSGSVGFIGLIVPHAVRMVVGPSHRRLILASAIVGAAFLILADLLARTLHSPEEIRLGAITAAIGAPFFLYLLVRHKREVECL